ncbi:D-TA family PLP-dependent enzyme [Tuwongella immobilis]|uniref:D-serine dehydratase-like domain-containing protein n=1 Tax=Tuwongella immobilis TaxID=692036 RepID=A0A6C2YNG3_9BACT|nr:D-TA family PLP-dependent enzyme [Tuwongella immobilis]VIP03158.1 Putative amino acid aldolase or racemase OS=Singulisphaera acidiphila (strain ATCC BAA-1392 / DSM 18658 / VKM B-2454 / MOB10) GN=Sinac_1200 PE=4 SV=1: Ala_racemase_N: D-ser_dehydrat [Tuwongella immobilis]VTS03561.1 Putative amino acid aldolase or racemase OS=Singulisphaera acidiphila (strain ATCC BAA-1392 / DSM 18658 / VKM B-2454 / MOB10) GN=Sinac_1200 PE=4 SV=1: Ala_racemase_N: D-ser_dehydrat [Tuwongella immobilis]
MLTSDRYRLKNAASVFSPALLFYRDFIEQNIALAVKMAGSADRLRPHVKTHKTREIVKMEQAQGIRKHKCATIAEAEMLGQCQADDVLIAYPLVGPNVQRLVALIRKYPATRFSCLIDHPKSAQALSDGVSKEGLTVDVVMDVDVGHHRTGIACGPLAASLYQQACQLPGLNPVGIQAYDGHNHQESIDERRQAVANLIGPLLELRATLERSGCPVPKLIAGGTPTFPMFASMNVPGLECSPGTFALHDAGYGGRYADLAGFIPAAVMLTRVISKPTPGRLTMDLGNKAIASDPPAGKRIALLDIPEYTPIMHNEEHFAIDTPVADRYEPGDEIYALPMHVCPTCALHHDAIVISQGEVVDRWEIASRNRLITV